jgi:hypothetical protein
MTARAPVLSRSCRWIEICIRPQTMDQKRRLEIVPSQVAAHLAELRPVLPLLRLCDGSRSFDAWCAAGNVPPDQMGRIVDRLITLGVVREQRPPRKEKLSPKGIDWAYSRGPDFSSDEEQFFASPIDHLLETG